MRISLGELGRPSAVMTVLEPDRQALRPGPDGRPHFRSHCGDVNAVHLVRGCGDIEMEPGLLALSHRQVVVQQLPFVGLDERGLDVPPHFPGKLPPREDDHHVHATPERVRLRVQQDFVRTVGLEDGVDHPHEIGHRRQEQLFFRETVECADDEPVVVRPLVDLLRLENLDQLATEDRDSRRVLRERLCREQAQEPPLALDFTIGPDLLDADIVHAGPSMHWRQGVRLRDDQHRPAYESRTQVGRQF